jgi:AraC-like DNA-binding protein
VPQNGTPFDWAWVDVAVPDQSHPLPGISMAGFRHRAPALVDIAMVAHPSVTMIINLSDRDGVVCDSFGRREHGSVVAGLLPGDLRMSGREGECLEIRLSPVAAAAMIGGSAELSGAVVPLEDLWGSDAERFADRLHASPSWQRRFEIAIDVLRRRLDARRPVDPEVAYSWRRTLVDRGRSRVDGLANEVGWSRKRLWSRFRSQLGVSPKRAAQLVRFDHAAHLLAAGQAPACVAADSGYVDQSHLHRDVKAISGLTPSAVATAPWLGIDDVAWPATSRGRQLMARNRP